MKILRDLGVGGLVIYLFARASVDDEPGISQLTQMMRHRGTGHIEQCGYVCHAFLAVAEKPEYANARRVAQLFEDLRRAFEVFDSLELRGYVFKVVIFAVIVRQIKLFHLNLRIGIFLPEKKLFFTFRATFEAFLDLDLQIYYTTLRTIKQVLNRKNEIPTEKIRAGGGVI